jgi:predicted hydrocarbon binding protein
MLEAFGTRIHASYAFWMKHLVERLGSDAVRQLWHGAFAKYDLAFLECILASGWATCAAPDSPDEAVGPPSVLGRYLGMGGQGMPASEAESLIGGTPPLPQFRARFPKLDVQRDTTTFEALHLYAHGPALLSEALIDDYGKEGELIAYDVLSAARQAMGKRMGGTVADFIRLSAEEFDKPGIYSAGLEIERISISPTEYITRIKECEWARYFQQKHPRVGYLMACSTDEAFARGFNESLRLQRTSTLMEGGDVCDFRFYSPGQTSGNADERRAT